MSRKSYQSSVTTSWFVVIMTTGGQYLLKMGFHLGSPLGRIQDGQKTYIYEKGRYTSAKEHVYAITVAQHSIYKSLWQLGETYM